MPAEPLLIPEILVFIMEANVNIETIRYKAQSLLEHKNLISSNRYIDQLENLIIELQTGYLPAENNSEVLELQGYLEKAKTRIDSLFYNAPVGYCVLDKNGCLVATNKAYCRLFQLDQSALEGNDLRQYIHPDSLDLFNFQINKIISSKNTLSTNLQFYQGEKVLFIRFQTTYYCEEDIDYLQCIVTDISDTKAIENELAASEAQFRNLLEASPVGILVLHKGKYIYSNKAAADIYGYSQIEKLIGITALESVEEECKAVFRERILLPENNNSNEPVELLIRSCTGAIKTCETVSIPVIYTNRLSALIIIKDVTVQRNDERLIRESEKNYKEMYNLLRLMCDNVPDMIWAKDLDNKYIFVNKAVSKDLLNAADTREPLGKTESYFAERERLMHPEDPEWHTIGESASDSDTAVLQNKEKQRFDETGYTNGQFLHLDVYKSPFYNSEGNIIGTVGSGRDVTHERWLQEQHRQAVDEIKAQSVRMNAILNVLPDLLFILNLKGEFLDCIANEPNKLLFDPANIKSYTLADIFSPQEVANQLHIYKQCVETKSVLSFEYTISINGQTQIFEARTTPLSDDSVLVIARNISEQKEAEIKLHKYNAELLAAKEEAEKNEKIKSAFFSILSHEIRTPMNSIMGFANLLNDPALDNEKRQQFTDIIIESTSNLLHVINEVLDFSKINSGTAYVHVSKCNMDEMLSQLLSVFNSKSGLEAAAKLRLCIEKPDIDSSPDFETDEIRLKQIFVILLDYALKHSKEGSIRFGYSKPENGKITCFVSYPGTEIKTKHQETIFDEFMLPVESDQEDQKGAGFALAICKGNAELLGGRIWVESEPDAEIRFMFELPFKRNTEFGTKLTQQKTTAMYNWKNKKIIIVEDHEQNLKYLTSILQRTGATVYQASNGTAFRQLLDQLPDTELILMDIQLPGEDGWQLTRFVKAIRPDIPVVIQSARAFETDRQMSFDAGCDSFIAKPFRPDELLEFISPFIAK